MSFSTGSEYGNGTLGFLSFPRPNGERLWGCGTIHERVLPHSGSARPFWDAAHLCHGEHPLELQKMVTVAPYPLRHPFAGFPASHGLCPASRPSVGNIMLSLSLLFSVAGLSDKSPTQVRGISMRLMGCDRCVFQHTHPCRKAESLTSHKHSSMLCRESRTEAGRGLR